MGNGKCLSKALKQNTTGMYFCILLYIQSHTYNTYISSLWVPSSGLSLVSSHCGNLAWPLPVSSHCGNLAWPLPVSSHCGNLAWPLPVSSHCGNLALASACFFTLW